MDVLNLPSPAPLLLGGLVLWMILVALALTPWTRPREVRTGDDPSDDWRRSYDACLRVRFDTPRDVSTMRRHAAPGGSHGEGDTRSEQEVQGESSVHPVNSDREKGTR